MTYQPPAPKLGWTDERVEQLKKLREDGLSAGQIAGAMGGTSRNAVLGKLHRLGLLAADKPTVKRIEKRTWQDRKQRAAATFANQSLCERQSPAPPSIDEPESLDRTVMTIGRFECRWTTSPTDAPHRFCGQPTLASPYCPYHSIKAHAPPRVSQQARAA